jgi:hypothetical protein
MIEESYFPVKEATVTYDTPNGDVYTGYKLIVREDRNQILSCMSEDYKLITNEQVMNKALPALKKNKAELVEYESFGQGARSQWKFRIPDIKVKIDNDDYVNPEIIIKNSYDGSTEVKAYGGAFRLVCSNGLVIGYALGQGTGIRHIGDNTEEDVEEIVEKIIYQVTEIFDKDFPKLVNTKVYSPHVSEVIKLFPETVMKDLVNKLIISNPQSYWDLLNACTFIATHKMKRHNEATHKLEGKIFPLIKGLANKAHTAQA